MALLIVGIAFILIGVFNLERVTESPLSRIIMVIFGCMLIAIVVTSCDPATDCDLEKNYGTTQGEVTSCVE